MTRNNIALHESFFDVVIRNKAYTTRKRLANHLDYIFSGTSLLKCKVLDVGGGTGLLTLWAAVEGADAVCLEPESAGATQSVRQVFDNLKRGISNELSATMSADLVQEYLSKSNKKFDVIVMANSINHIDEENCTILLKNEEARRQYVAFFQQIRAHLNPCGKLIITDCDRHNFFGDIGLKSPFMPSIDWSIHQSPSTWGQLMEEAGFRVIDTKWTTPNALGLLGQFLLGNRMAAYFLFSHFRVMAEA